MSRKNNNVYSLGVFPAFKKNQTSARKFLGKLAEILRFHYGCAMFQNRLYIVLLLSVSVLLCLPTYSSNDELEAKPECPSLAAEGENLAVKEASLAAFLNHPISWKKSAVLKFFQHSRLHDFDIKENLKLVGRDPVQLIQRLFLYVPNHCIAVLVRLYGLNGVNESATQIAEDFKVSTSTIGNYESQGFYFIYRAFNNLSAGMQWKPLHSIKLLKLTNATEHKLLRAGYFAIEQLMQTLEMDLADLPNFGPLRTAEVNQALRNFNGSSLLALNSELSREKKLSLPWRVLKLKLRTRRQLHRNLKVETIGDLTGFSEADLRTAEIEQASIEDLQSALQTFGL